MAKERSSSLTSDALGAARKLMGALYEDGDTFFCRVYSEEGAERHYRKWVRDRLEERGGKYGFQSAAIFSKGRSSKGTSEVCEALLHRYVAKEHLALAISVGVFGLEGSRTEENCTGLSAFGIDIDPKDFDKLVPGATNIEPIVDEVRRRLARRGLPPHAIVNSGRGVHVYLLMERHRLATSDDRHRAREVWWRLCQVLGGASDRYDLASILRIPGSVNWKQGTRKPVFFIPKETDLTRQRFTFEEIADAVADMPPLTRSTKSTRRMAAPGFDFDEPLPDHMERIFAVAMHLSRPLRETKARTLNPATNDKSAADFGYASEMVQIGLPPEVVIRELHQTLHAATNPDPKRYVERTFQSAVERAWCAASTDNHTPFDALSNVDSALYLPVRHEVPEGTESTTTGGDQSPVKTESKVKVVFARAGEGKTRGVMDALSHQAAVNGDRTAFLGMFVRELLKHEYAINRNYPGGFGYESNGMWFEYADEPLPETHEKLFERLPEHVRENWPLDRLKVDAADPAAFFVNSKHPIALDERLVPEGGPDDPDPPRPSWRSRSPAAVAKFRGRADFCLAGHAPRVFSSPHPPCGSECMFRSCRANVARLANATEPEDVLEGDTTFDDGSRLELAGAKTFWSRATVPLLTHRSFFAQAVFKPGNNDFTRIVVDELPQFVYRYPSIVLRRELDKRQNATWTISPLDVVEGAIRRVLEDPERKSSKFGAGLARVLEALIAFRDVIVDRARKRREKVIEGTAGAVPYERRVDIMSPVLSTADFMLLCELANEDQKEREEDGEIDLDLRDLSTALESLRDFCGDEQPYTVILQHSFDARGNGAMSVCRPVDGWDDLLLDEGREREVMLLDATACVDPRYLLRGNFPVEKYPDSSFPNTMVILTAAMSKTKVEALTPTQIVDDAIKAVAPYLQHLQRGLLFLTNKDTAGGLSGEVMRAVERGLLPRPTEVAHFGSLRGRNDFDDFDGAYLTHPHRYDEGYYLGLHGLLTDFEKMPRQWTSRNDKRWRRYESLAARSMVSDLYQDTLRIGIRRDPSRKAFIFVPTANAAIIVRLMRLFRNATLVFPDERQVEGRKAQAASS